MPTSRDINELQEEFFRYQLQRNREMLAELKEMKLLLLEIGKSLIDIQALVHPAALLNTLAHIKDKAAAEEAREQAKTQNETPPNQTPPKRRDK